MATRSVSTLRTVLAPVVLLLGVGTVLAAPTPAAAASYGTFHLLDEGPVNPTILLTADGLWTVYWSEGQTELRSVPTSGGRVRTLHRGNVTPVLSPDSGRVVYGDGATLWSQPVAGGPETVLTTFPTGVHDQVTITPDGQWVLFRSDAGGAGQFDLFRVPVGGGAVTRVNGPLTAGGAVEFYRVSHDGASVAYRADQEVAGRFDLYVAPTSGGTAVRFSGPLPGNRSVINLFEWAPDDSWLVYAAEAATADQYDLYAVGGAGPVTLLTATPLTAELDWIFAPDSSFAVVTARFPAGGYRVERVGRTGADRVVLATNLNAGEANFEPFQVVPGADARLVFRFVDAGGAHFASVRLDGTGRVTLTGASSTGRLTPGGSHLVHNEFIGARWVVKVGRIDGSDTPVTIADPAVRILGVANDSQNAVVISNDDAFRAPLTGTGLESLIGKPAFTETAGSAVTADGRHVVVVRDQYADGRNALLSVGPTFDATDTTAFTPLPPTRVLDTRLDQQIGFSGPKPLAGETVRLKLRGRAGIPDLDDVRAVVLNVTATEASGPGYVTVWPAGAGRPLASSLNLETAGQTRPNLVTVALGVAGSVDLFTQSGTHLVADVAGYYSGAGSAAEGRFFPLSPSRVLDTRGAGARPGAGATVTLPLAGRGGLPGSGLSAVVLNVTATDAGAAGFVTVWPSGRARPLASNLNLERAGQTIPNQVIVPVGADGSVQLFTQSGTHLVADVAGWFTDGSEGFGTSGLYRSFSPIRMLDTRPASRQGWSGAKPGPGAVVPVSFSTPGEGTIAYTANVTMTEADLPGFVTAWPNDLPRPLASNLNTDSFGQTIPNHVTVRAGRPREEFRLFTLTGGHLVVDVTGTYFA